MHWTWGSGLQWPIWLKLAISITFDLLDLTIGRFFLGISLIGEVCSALLMMILWGPLGLLTVWEAGDLTEQIDGFVPSNLIVGVLAARNQLRERKKLAAAAADA